MAITFLVFFILMLLAVPIGYIMGFSSMVGLFAMGGFDFLEPVAVRLHAGSAAYVLVAIPFFILAAELLNRSGMTEQLIRFANSLMGHLHGGLSHVNIFASILFSGLTGAAVTDTVAIGGILIPAMKKQGYEPGYSAAVTATSSVIGPIIPPSIVMVLYASILRLSVPAIFAAAIIPGLLCGIALLVISFYMSWRRKYPRYQKASFKEIRNAGYQALLAMGTGIIILGTILFGITTVSEAAALGALYAMIIGMFVYRSLTIKDIWASMISTVRLSGIVFLLIAAAAALGWFITLSGVIDATAKFSLSISHNPMVILTLVDAFILIVCMFIDVIPAALILGPVLSPAMAKIGVNPIHFAMIMMLGLNIGNATPPMGMTLMTASQIADIPYEKSMKDAMYFIAAEVVMLLVVTYLPFFSLWLPGILGYS
ncbi:MAG: TRAP transporter large permease [Deltaproteobacteria bacterium]|nr:TRAP transporter large permease [Deltaproteobacteria bacterium]